MNKNIEDYKHLYWNQCHKYNKLKNKFIELEKKFIELEKKDIIGNINKIYDNYGFIDNYYYNKNNSCLFINTLKIGDKVKYKLINSDDPKYNYQAELLEKL